MWHRTLLPRHTCEPGRIVLSSSPPLPMSKQDDFPQGQEVDTACLSQLLGQLPPGLTLPQPETGLIHGFVGRESPAWVSYCLPLLLAHCPIVLVRSDSQLGNSVPPDLGELPGKGSRQTHRHTDHGSIGKHRHTERQRPPEGALVCW